ncbi:hypothetical protein Efla_002616 [Eimeria flavescens]
MSCTRGARLCAKQAALRFLGVQAPRADVLSSQGPPPAASPPAGNPSSSSSSSSSSISSVRSSRCLPVSASPCFLSFCSFSPRSTRACCSSLGLLTRVAVLVVFQYITSVSCFHPLSSSSSLSPGLAAHQQSLQPPPWGPSALQTAARNAPPLNLEEDESCLFTDSVPANVERPVVSVNLEPSQWAEHVEDVVSVQVSLKAYQTTDVPGRERQFMLTFKLPADLAESGAAVLRLEKMWDGKTHGWECDSHVLQVIRLADDKYLQGRNAASETEDRLELPIDKELREYILDLSPLVYGQQRGGQPLHLLFREKNKGCLSGFVYPNEQQPGPVLTVDIVDLADADAVYGQWEPFAKCRVSCVTPFNFQCRKRACTAGKNGGAACKKELMVDKQPCADASVSESCTCEALTKEAACPAYSSCDDSVGNNVACKCSGEFVRDSVESKTVCQTADISLGTFSEALKTTSQTSSTLIALWVVLGLFCFLVVFGCVILLCVKRRAVRDEDLLNMNIDPLTGAPAPGVPDLGASMFWGQSPAVPMGGGPPLGGPRGSFAVPGAAGPLAPGGPPSRPPGGGPPVMGYGMGGGPQQGVLRAPSYAPRPPGFPRM